MEVSGVGDGRLIGTKHPSLFKLKSNAFVESKTSYQVSGYRTKDSFFFVTLLTSCKTFLSFSNIIY